MKITLTGSNPRFVLDFLSAQVWGAVIVVSEHIWKDQAPDDAEAAVVAELALDLILDQRRQEPIFRGLRRELYEP